jgi:hypothetical protein
MAHSNFNLTLFTEMAMVPAKKDRLLREPVASWRALSLSLAQADVDWKNREIRVLRSSLIE